MFQRTHIWLHPFLLEIVLFSLHLLSVLWLQDHVASCHLTQLDLDLVLFVSQTVIRAKVVGEKEVDSGNDIYGNPIKRIQYEVKQIKVGPPCILDFKAQTVSPLFWPFDPLAVVWFQMFKGPNQDIEAVFTAPVSAVCGVTLDANGKKEYLISGVYNQIFVWNEGRAPSSRNNYSI